MNSAFALRDRRQARYILDCGPKYCEMVPQLSGVGKTKSGIWHRNYHGLTPHIPGPGEVRQKVQFRLRWQVWGEVLPPTRTEAPGGLGTRPGC